MRKVAACLFFLFVATAFNSSFCQLWKQYFDSAKLLAKEPNATAKAIDYFNKSKALLPTDSFITRTHAVHYYNLGLMYNRVAKYDSAILQFSTAISMFEKSVGNKHQDYASCCSSLGSVYLTIGQYDKAESLLAEAKVIIENTIGKNTNAYSVTCYNLAHTYLIQSRYAEAEPLLLEIKEIDEKTYGFISNKNAFNSNMLGMLYENTNYYQKAEKLYVEAKRIMDSLGSKKNQQYASIIGNLGQFYMNLGFYSKAEPLLIETNQIRKEALGENSVEYAKGINNLGNLYLKTKQYDKTEYLYLEARKIFVAANGAENADYAYTSAALGALYFTENKFEKAEPYFLESRSVWAKVFGKMHPLYAISCLNLGSLYTNTGQYSKADGLLKESERIFDSLYGKRSPAHVEVFINSGMLNWQSNRFKNTYAYLEQAFAAQNSQLKKIFQFTSEHEKESFIKTTVDLKDYYLSLVSNTDSTLPKGSVYNLSLFNRNLILSSSQQLQQAMYDTQDTIIRKKYEAWVYNREKLSSWYAKPVIERPFNIKDLEARTDDLEKELVRHSYAFRNQQDRNGVTWQSVKQKLKPAEATIEFVEFVFFNGKRWTDSTYYIALLLRKDKPGPELIRLFEKKQLNGLMNNAGNDKIEENIVPLYTHHAGIEKATSTKSVYDLVWKPLDKHLKGITKVYFAPSGLLHRIAFAAMPVNAHQVLGDKYQLVQLNTTASIVNQQPDHVTAGKIQIYGGVRYDADSTALKQTVSQYQKGHVVSRSISEDRLRGSSSWSYLPGTETEINAIAYLAKQKNVSTTVLNGIGATEESVKLLNGNSSPTVLHIATHGFFSNDPTKDTVRAKFETSGKVFKQSDNPLIRSALLFAGANYAWRNKPIEGIEDGILTAYEVSNMYLPNTKLVVLSACETALGDIQGSEGVYGLQRAFKMAGVEHLVMSLWKVPDAETAEFMQEFYKHLFNKISISDAFYKAQTTMKNKFRHEPYKWAAWVLVR